MNNENENVSLHELRTINVKKSNTLIQSIGKTSLLSNKIFLTALLKVEKRDGCKAELKPYYQRIENKVGVDFTRGLVSEFSNSDMRNFMSKSGSYYKAVEELMDNNSPESLKKQWGIMVHNPEDGLYGFVDVITSMIYDSKQGKLFVKFSDEPKIQAEIYNLRRNYTTLNYSLMMSFRSVYSYRIYEMILSRIGYDDWRNKGKKSQEYNYDYGLSELKYQLGILDPYISPSVKEAIMESKTPEDFERIEETISTEHKMPRYNDFEKYTLRKAIKEINSIENPEYYFDYSPIRGGRGGKVRGVLFTIKRVSVPLSGDTITDDEKDDCFDQIRELISEDLKTRDIRTIAEAAHYDFEKVKKAYEIASASTKDIPNLVGFLRTAIKESYEAPVRKNAKNAFLNMERVDVDYDEIAKQKWQKRLTPVQEILVFDENENIV